MLEPGTIPVIVHLIEFRGWRLGGIGLSVVPPSSTYFISTSKSPPCQWQPMAAKEHPPHSKSTTTLKTAIRQAAQIPAIPRALHPTPPTANHPTFSRKMRILKLAHQREEKNGLGFGFSLRLGASARQHPRPGLANTGGCQ